MHEREPVWKKIIAVDWSQRVTALLIAFFLLQFIGWIVKEETLWLAETVSLVKWTLFFVCASYMIPHIPVLLRSMLQLLLIFYIHATLLGYEYVKFQRNETDSLQQWFLLNFSQLEPFIYFSLASWAVYLFCIWMAGSKPRIYLMILVSVLFFAIRDSFSTIILWQQVSLILFCGLSLLVIRHFSELKLRAPKSWETLAEYPLSIGIPIVALVALTIVIGALTPSFKPILTDPYTAWKVSRGEPITLSGKGIGIALPTSASSSGYSRDDRQLGGSFQFDYSPVMTVNADKRAYWRGETRSLYNGSGWELSDSEKRLPLTAVNAEDLKGDPRFDTSQLKTVDIKQSVQIDNDEIYPVLFGAFPISKVEDVNNGESLDPLRWSARQSEVRFTAKSNYPKNYKIISKAPVIDEAGLKQVTADYTGKPEWNEYLQLPKDLPARVKQLATELTKDEPTPYDKIKKIESYLSKTFPYTNTPDQSKGKSKDFVDRFLFEIKEGYCDYYSTAMVVLSRSIGMPTRWVKGYSTGQSPIPDEIQQFGILSQGLVNVGPGLYTVRNSDAHSWVEVYFSGYGWIPFEPTSGFTLPTVLPDDQPIQPDTAVSGEPINLPANSEATASFSWISFAIIAVSSLIILASAIFLIMRLGLIAAWKDKSRRAYATNFNQKIIVEFERLLKYSRRKGYSRREYETMREAVGRWGQRSKWLKPDLETVLNLFEKAKYSQATASEQEYTLVTQAIDKLRTQMK